MHSGNKEASVVLTQGTGVPGRGSSVDRGSGSGEHSTCKKEKVRSAGVRDDAGGVGRGQSVGTSKVTFRSLGFIRRLVGSHGSDCSWNITQLDWIGMGGSTQIRVRPRS